MRPRPLSRVRPRDDRTDLFASLLLASPSSPLPPRRLPRPPLHLSHFCNSLEVDPFDALSSDEDLDLADNLTSRSSTHGGSARSGPLDGPARATVKADLNGTYGAGARAGREFGLEKDENEDEKPSGPRPAVVYDDDDDEW